MSNKQNVDVQFSFLENKILEALAQAHILSHLNEEQQQVYMSQFFALAIERIGMEALAALPADKHSQFALLIKNSDMTPDRWYFFWNESIPQFDVFIEKVLASFMDDMKRALLKSSL